MRVALSAGEASAPRGAFGPPSIDASRRVERARRRGRAIGVLASVLAFALACWPAAAARADCTERTLGEVATVADCSDGTPRRWTVVEVDLAHADVGLRVTRASERGRTASDWLASASVEHAVAVVQGGPFRFDRLSPEGLTVAEGEAWSETSDDGARALLLVGAGNVAAIVEEERIVPAEGWMRSVVSGGALLVRDGTARGSCDGRACERAPRTGIGLSEDGRTLSMVVVEGWTARSLGATEPELASLLRGAGAWRALSTGSGATSTLWLSDAPDAVPSSDGAERVAAAFLAVIDVASGATRRLVGVVEARDGSPLPEATVTVETLDGRPVGAPPTLNEAGYFEVRVPIRDYYVVRASLAGYRTGCVLCDVVASRDENWCSFMLDRGDGEDECPVPSRVLDAGPYPIGAPDAGREAGPDAGPGRGGDGGCAVAGAGERDAGAYPGLLGLAAVVLAATRRRRPALVPP